MINASDICQEFIASTTMPKYILGRNIYSECVAKLIKIDGFIDEYTNESEWIGLPIHKLNDIPNNAIVLNAAGGRIHTAKRRLNDNNITNIDYFTFRNYTNLPLIEARFNEGFKVKYESNKYKFDWVHDLLSDSESREVFNKLVSFKLSYDISFLETFIQNEENQYFDDFLNLNLSKHVFLDIGAFDGHTTLKFIEKCPQYAGIHVFEPDPLNLAKVKDRLKEYDRIIYYDFGISSELTTLKFDIANSNSSFSDSGAISVPVNKLDNVIKFPVTFIKMDIEGGEISAILGAVNTINAYHPILAIAAYHGIDDFWRIPEIVLSIRSDYNIYMRHYTESIYETILFFIPK